MRLRNLFDVLPLERFSLPFGLSSYFERLTLDFDRPERFLVKAK